MDLERLHAAALRGDDLSPVRDSLEAALPDPAAGRVLVLWTLRARPPLQDVGDVVAAALQSGDPVRISTMEAALAEAVSVWAIPGRIPAAIMGGLIAELERAEPADAARVLAAIDFTSKVEALAAVPAAAVIRWLPDHGRRVVSILEKAVLGGGAVVPAELMAGLAHPDAATRFGVGRVLGAYAARDGDTDLVERLFATPDSDARQGAAEALRAASAIGVDLAFAVPALARGALDPAAGVAYYATKTLMALAERGVDLAEAETALEDLLDRDSYGPRGWYGDIGYLDDSASESPRRDAAKALAAWRR